MKALASIIIAIIVLAAIFIPQAFFVVDETNMAIVTRFGEPLRSVKTPGLNIKAPFVDQTRYFDKRLLLFDAPPYYTLLTKDKKRLVIDIYARGKITDPFRFYRTLNSESQAQSRVIAIISSELREEIAKDTQAEIIRTSRSKIMNNVRDAVAPQLSEFGIVIIDVRMKRADFPPEISESIYERMRAERKRIADRERAEGAQQDAEIRSSVDRQTAIIRAEAERDANIVRGAGEAESISIFAEAVGQSPDFYKFQRSLEAYSTSLKENSTLVIPAESDLFEFLQSPQPMQEK
jgi:membrane protease subunit HflC